MLTTDNETIKLQITIVKKWIRRKEIYNVNIEWGKNTDRHFKMVRRQHGVNNNIIKKKKCIGKVIIFFII